MDFDLAERIKQVRTVEDKMEAMEKAFKETLKPFKDFAEAGRTEILEFLNATGQKSANTPNGTAYWKTKVTYRVADRSEFQAHVISVEAWELVTWGAAGTAAEAFTEEHGEPPPGCIRNAVNILYITAPAKPRTKVAKASEAEPDDGGLPEAAE